MEILPLQAIPNQEFQMVLNDNRWDISIKTTNGAVAVTLIRNNVMIIENLRAVAGMRIIPSEYEEDGNFTIITQSGEIPDYTKFGITQYMVYASAADLQVIRSPVSPPITASFFDPIAELPLRFAPQGYTYIGTINRSSFKMAPKSYFVGAR